MQWNKNRMPQELPDESKTEIENHQERSELILLTNLLQRDIRCWFVAIYKGWIFYAVLPLLFCIAFFLFRYLTAPKLYSSSCGLIRQELTDLRNSGLPPGYSNIQRQVILNMMDGRSVLEQTVLRLNLPYSYRSLFSRISVALTARNSNYFIISAIDNDPEMSAKIANTMAEAFIEDYKKLIRSNLERMYENRIRNQAGLEKEISAIQQRLKSMYKECELNSIDREEANNNQRIMLTEDRISQANTQIAAFKERLNELEIRLPDVPESIITYSESNAKNDQQLIQARQKLSEMLERYTEENPRIINQRSLVAKLEAEYRAREGVDETPSKVVTGLNPEYIQIKRDINKLSSEIVSSQSEIKEFTERLVEFRTRRELLTRLGPDLRALESELRQKKNMLDVENVLIKELELFLERSFSDISIQEPARAPNGPLPRRLSLFGVLGFLFGIFLATTIVLIRELLNLTTRSETDMVKALHLPPLATLPVLEHKYRADFYGALQLTVTHVDDILQGEHSRKPAFAVIAPYYSADINTELFDDLYESIAIRKDWSYTVIRSAPDNEDTTIIPYLINDYLYQLSQECPKPNKKKTLYFKLDDLSFISPPGAKDVEKLLSALQCDIVFWELFDFELHRQLFVEITKTANFTIIPMRYEKTSKTKVFRMLRQFRTSGVENVFGLLFDISIKFYRRSL